MLSAFKRHSGILMVAACVCSAQAAPTRQERLEQVLSRQPAAVQSAIRAQVGNGKLQSIQKEENGGDVTYDVELVRAGKTRSFAVSAEGELLDAEVFMDELPAAVQQAIRQKVGSATLGEIDKSFDDQEISYDVEMISAGKSRTFTMDAGGKLIDEEVLLSELPAAMQKAIQKEAGEGTVDGIIRSIDGSDTFYDVDISRNGKSRTVTLDANGTLVCAEEEIALAEVPAAAKTQIQTLSASGKVIGITKVSENGTISFDVDIREHGKLKSYTVAENGTADSSNAQ
jgi:uncharacterized membrane protein YkoI